jgi:hypothetical protein
MNSSEIESEGTPDAQGESDQVHVAGEVLPYASPDSAPTGLDPAVYAETSMLVGFFAVAGVIFSPAFRAAHGVPGYAHVTLLIAVGIFSALGIICAARHFYLSPTRPGAALFGLALNGLSLGFVGFITFKILTS